MPAPERVAFNSPRESEAAKINQIYRDFQESENAPVWIVGMQLPAVSGDRIPVNRSFWWGAMRTNDFSNRLTCFPVWRLNDLKNSMGLHSKMLAIVTWNSNLVQET